MRVAEAPNHNRISISSRLPGLNSTPSFERSIASCLPPELLAAIFLEYAEDYRTSMRVPRWVAVSYVCRYWRNVALGCARLWAYPFFVSPEWIDEQLRRSKTVPLTVRIHVSWVPHDSRLTRSLEKVLENVNRIQVLHVGSPSHDIVDLINAGLDAPAPLLQSLHLSAMYCPGIVIL